MGRFVEKKGIALIRPSLDIPGVAWTFVGWGPLSPGNWSELPDNARVFERLSAADVVPLYQEADLLVLPSSGEGFPLVIQEALACGTPVLVSKEVEEAVNDVAVEPGDRGGYATEYDFVCYKLIHFVNVKAV